MSELRVNLGGREVGDGRPPFFIAEMSGNHNHSLERALAIVDAAADAGADALKIQTYTPDTMTIDYSEKEFFISDPKSLWKGSSLYDLYKKAYTPWEWHKPIFDRCREHGMIAFSTPFDASSVEFLESLGMPFYKIASFEAVDLPLIRRVAKTGKPMIISTGMTNQEEIEDAVSAARGAGCKELILLKCTSAYPATAADANVTTVAELRKRFSVVAGLSDHTLGHGVALSAIALGAAVVEKHFTLKRAEGGVDSAFSMEPNEFRIMKEEGVKAWEAVGRVSFERSSSEQASMIYRRSVYVVEDVRTGDTLSEKNIRVIRPGFGMAPKHYESVLGKRAARDLKRGTALTWDAIEG